MGSKRLANRSLQEVVDVARARAVTEYLVALMRSHDGNVTHAARHAGLARTYLQSLLKSHGVRSGDFKTARFSPLARGALKRLPGSHQLDAPTGEIYRVNVGAPRMLLGD